MYSLYHQCALKKTNFCVFPVLKSYSLTIKKKKPTLKNNDSHNFHDIYFILKRKTVFLKQ